VRLRRHVAEAALRFCSSQSRQLVLGARSPLSDPGGILTCVPDPSDAGLGRWHLNRPAVYLDQWVWVSLTRAAKRRPQQPSHALLLDACHAAAADGVAFPLSSTHYFELQRTKDPRQRFDVADVMAPISSWRTLRSRRDLVKHQMRTVLHEQLGRPAFRPAPVKVLGRGVAWAFMGGEMPLRVSGPDDPVTEDEQPGLAAVLRAASQYAEYHFLAGPRDEDVEALRALGYRPEVTAASSQSRLDFETFLATSLTTAPVSARELRVYLVARELVHEYLEPFNELTAEYRISLGRDLGFDPEVPGAGRAKMMGFAEAVPTLKLSVDLKYGLFRDQNRTWTLNHLSDVDAVAVAAPYCRVVVTDADVASRARHTKAAQNLGTVITADVEEVLNLLPALAAEARQIGGF